MPPVWDACVTIPAAHEQGLRRALSYSTDQESSSCSAAAAPPQQGSCLSHSQPPSRWRSWKPLATLLQLLHSMASLSLSGEKPEPGRLQVLLGLPFLVYHLLGCLSASGPGTSLPHQVPDPQLNQQVSAGEKQLWDRVISILSGEQALSPWLWRGQGLSLGKEDVNSIFLRSSKVF